MADDYDTARLEDMLARLRDLERQVAELKRSLGSDSLRSLDEDLRLKGLK